AVAIDAEIGDADIVAENDEDVWLALTGRFRLGRGLVLPLREQTRRGGKHQCRRQSKAADRPAAAKLEMLAHRRPPCVFFDVARDPPCRAPMRQARSCLLSDGMGSLPESQRSAGRADDTSMLARCRTPEHPRLAPRRACPEIRSRASRVLTAASHRGV